MESAKKIADPTGASSFQKDKLDPERGTKLIRHPLNGHRRARPWPKPLTRDPHSQARPVQHHHSQPILLAIVSPLGPCRDNKPKHKFIARSKKTLKCLPKTGRGQTTKNHRRTADKPLPTTSEPRTNHWPTRMPRDSLRRHLNTGGGHWPWPLAMATGHGRWSWPLAMASGHACWPWPLAMSAGHGHWPWASGQFWPSGHLGNPLLPSGQL